MNKLIVSTVLILVPQLVFGAGFAQWGIASSHPATSGVTTAVKFVEFGKSGEQGKLAYTIGVGGWTDTTKYRTELTSVSNSLFFENLYGVDPHCGPVYLTYKLGPAIMTNTDALIGSNVVVGHEFGIGVRDTRDVRVGIVIKHFSNAGIVKPNTGRDFIGMRIEW